MDRHPQWYKDAVIYQTHIKAFSDAGGDGVGDFRGLTQKLDYLQHLGVTAIWILPFYPSPLRDDGYDIADYTSVNPAYGTLRDFKAFLKEAHARGLRVITELVLNHTSDQHPWFQKSRKAKPGAKWRDFYVWSDTPDRYRDARVIFQDFEHSNWTWDHEAGAYYWHRFYHHQPDLNFDNPEVQEATFQILHHWLEMGVDGMRLDAVPYLFEREGTNCENLPETHQYLKDLRAYVDKHFDNRMMLAEANQWPEDAVAYFGDGDECHTAFHFPVMPRLFMGVQMEDRFPIIDILEQTPEIPENCQWVLFLRNHDELTLEMVTDEERDYMYRVYARDPQARVNLGIRRRLAPLLGNNRRKIELLNGLLMSLPGTPVLYYGDEIGMGDNIYLGDRDSVRTPMQWSADRNAGFSTANPQKLYLPLIIDHEYHYEAINVETQQNNPTSLLWWMRRLIALRQEFRAFGRGKLAFLYPENPKVIAFVRSYEDENILVVANLSRFSQYVELDLSEHRGATPMELFGHTEFPKIGELPYLLTLGPHAFYWFSLQAPSYVGPQEGQPVGEAVEVSPREKRKTLKVEGDWLKLLERPKRQQIERLLPDFLIHRRWYQSKARKIRNLTIEDVITLAHNGETTHGCLALLRIEFTEGEPDTYIMPLSFLSDDEPHYAEVAEAPAVLANVQVTGENEAQGVLYESLTDQRLGRVLLDLIGSEQKLNGKVGQVGGTADSLFEEVRKELPDDINISLLGAEQSNTSLLYGDRLLLKLFRRLEEGVNPDLEISRFLTEANFENAPPVAGWLEYESNAGEGRTLAILQGYIRNQGDAWQHSLDAVGRYFERILSEQRNPAFASMTPPTKPPVALSRSNVPELAEELMGPYLAGVELLGRRTGELHLALASNEFNKAFAPEPFTQLYQRALYQGSRSSAVRTLRLLSKRKSHLPEELQEPAQALLDNQDQVVARFDKLRRKKIDATRIRCHGDFHLGQVLYTGKDFVIIDFEGEPARPISERRIKRSPLRDVAGMLRSFDYAAYCGLTTPMAGVVVQEDQLPALDPWVSFFASWAGAVFLKSYLETTAGASFIPQENDDIQLLLDIYLLEKALYELSYELNNRPDWVRVPLSGIRKLLAAGG